ncbi:MAG: hypothetical protein WC595_06210 [Candidatus Nanoarchaeia archaeon]
MWSFDSIKKWWKGLSPDGFEVENPFEGPKKERLEDFRITSEGVKVVESFEKEIKEYFAAVKRIIKKKGGKDLKEQVNLYERKSESYIFSLKEYVDSGRSTHTLFHSDKIVKKILKLDNREEQVNEILRCFGPDIDLGNIEEYVGIIFSEIKKKNIFLERDVNEVKSRLAAIDKSKEDLIKELKKTAARSISNLEEKLLPPGYRKK